MYREVLEYTPVSRETLYYNDEEVIVATTADLTDLVERNKAMYAQTDEHARYGEWTHVASIPPEIMDDWFRTGRIHDQRALRDWLNDNYNRAFRTRPGRV